MTQEVHAQLLYAEAGFFIFRFSAFVPNVSLHFNPIDSQSLKQTSYSISSKSDLKVVLDARIYTK